MYGYLDADNMCGPHISNKQKYSKYLKILKHSNV